MARYIDAEELCRRLTECWHTNDTEKGKNIQAVIDRVVTPIVVGTPTADVVEVKHGKWYRHTKKEHGDTCFYCSVCNKMALSDCLEWELTDYCPNCGAKMDGGKTE